MANNADNYAYLWDMLDAARTVQELIQDKTFEAYVADKGLRLAVERALEIIGEAARHVSDAFRDRHAEIPWRPIIAQRHVLAHEYGAIMHDRIWKVATMGVPDLIANLEPLISDTPDQA